MIGVHAVLTGQCVAYEYRVARHDRSPKKFTIKFQPERDEGAFFARLEEGPRGYGTPFGFAGSFAFQTVIAAVLRLEYPDRSEDMLMGSHYRMARLYAQRAGP